MIKKSGNFFEEHVEKIILGVIGLVCIWLLITRVLFSPNLVEYDNQKFSTGSIDIHISKQQAEVLEDKLNSKPNIKQAYKRQFDSFAAMVDSAIANIDTSVYIRQPFISSRDVSSEGIYNIPDVGEVDDVKAEHIRTVAYVPVVEIDQENPYSGENSEPNDLDFVTVEAKFDITRLYENFRESFAGDNVREEWRDPCLAVPIFAAVQLQRQQLDVDGSWSDWQTVPRIKIDPRREMFEVIEDVTELPEGGMKVRLLQFDDAEVRMDLLQPESYVIASAREEWFPPSLHKKFVKQQKEQASQERRQAKAAEKEEREEERERLREERISRRTTRTTRTTPSSATGGMADGYGMMMDMMMGAGGPPSTTTRAQPRRTRSRNRSERSRTRGGRSGRENERGRPSRSRDTKEEKDIYDEFDGILLTSKSNVGKMQELVFWAYDDTVEPDKSYQYRIRLGIFDPIAGTDQFSEEYKSLKNNVILWSKFSDTTESVTVPAKLYFFPLDIQEAIKMVSTVKVTVARYVLGYWYSNDFTVKRGEVIGKAVDTAKEEKEAAKEATGEDVTIPEMIDYSTGAVLVDVRGPVNDWLGGRNLRPRQYYDMLYSFDGTKIEHLPIESRYWAKGLLVKFNEIKRSEKEPKEALRVWGGRTGRRGRIGGPAGPGGPTGFEAADEYMRMMEEMMRQGMY